MVTHRYGPALVAAVAVLFTLLIAALPMVTPASAQTPNPYLWKENGYIISLVVTPEDPPTMFALTNRYEDSSYRNHWGIYTSTNGGSAWSPFDTKGLEGVLIPDFMTIDYKNPSNLYLIGTGKAYNKYFFKKTGAGPWIQIGDRTELTAIAVDFRDSNLLFGAENVPGYCPYGRFVVSRDGGVTWQPAPGTGAPPATENRLRIIGQILINPNQPDMIFAAADRRDVGRCSVMPTVYRVDWSGNWVQLKDPPAGQPYVYPGRIAFDAPTNTLYTGSELTWGLYSPPQGLPLWLSTNAHSAAPSAVDWKQVGRFDIGPWGRTFQPLAVNSRPPGALFVQTIGLASGLGSSTDGGATWKRLRAPVPETGPGRSAVNQWISPITGHPVSGEWLDFFQQNGGLDILGHPRTGVVKDPANDGQWVQYFQRMIVEWRGEDPAGQRLQRRLLGDILYPGAEGPATIDDAPPGPSQYFRYAPDAPTGLGHYVANATKTGQPIYFLDYFNEHGGVNAFGYPKEEPVVRGKIWTQRFQAAVFEYHPEYDINGDMPSAGIPYRQFRVQLRLLGDEFITKYKLPFE